MVCHCCARQDTSIRLTYRAEDGDLPIGEIDAVVYDREFLDQGAKCLKNVAFSDHRQEFAFGSQLHRSFWNSASLRSLTMQDRVYSLTHDDHQVTHIEIPHHEGRWFGCCAFERVWDDDGRVENWLENAAQLASESLTLRTNFSAASLGHSRLLEPWLSHVYQLLDVNAVSESVLAMCSALGGLTLNTGDSTHVIPFEKGSIGRYVSATAGSSLMWLPSDVCTASAIAIEQFLYGEPDSKMTDAGSQPDSVRRPESNGYVRDPADDSAYVSKSKILSKHTPATFRVTDKRLTDILANYAEYKVRWTRPISGTTGKPHPQRLSINLSDWVQCVDRATKSSVTDEDGECEVLPTPAEIEQRMAEIRRSKAGK